MRTCGKLGDKMKLQEAMAASEHGLAMAPMIGANRVGCSVLASAHMGEYVLCQLVRDGQPRGVGQWWPASYVETVTQPDAWHPLSANDCVF